MSSEGDYVYLGYGDAQYVPVPPRPTDAARLLVASLPSQNAGTVAAEVEFSAGAAPMGVSGGVNAFRRWVEKKDDGGDATQFYFKQ